MQNKGIYALIYDFLYIIWQFYFFFYICGDNAVRL